MQNRTQNKALDKCCELCPKRLGVSSPSPMALESIHEIQYEIATSAKRGKKPNGVPEVSGCAWYINSAEHNYCFWDYAETLDKNVPDKDICQLLGITQIQLRESFGSAIKKLKQREQDGSQDIQEFIEILLTRINLSSTDGDMPFDGDVDIFSAPVVEHTPDDMEEEIKAILSSFKKRNYKGNTRNGMPMHRDGKKVDLYGLSSKKNPKK